MKLQNIFFAAIILLAAFQINFAQQKVKNIKCQIPFELRYEKIGIIYLLLEPQYFKPEQLKSLFGCLSRNRAKFVYLIITVLSDEKQLNKAIKSFKNDLTRQPGLPPENHARYPEGYKPPPPPPPDYYRAFYSRYKEEYFQYSQNPQKWELTTVIIKRNILIK